MNKVETALTHALFTHLHHNIDKAIDFNAIDKLNEDVNKMWPGALVVGPGDDAAVFKMPGSEDMFVAKMESHCSPAVVNPYNAAATAATGAMRDVVAMGARPYFMLDFIGTRPIDELVLVGPCAFDKEICACGKCEMMTSGDRINLIAKGVVDACRTMGVFLIGGGLSTSFTDIVPAIVGTIIGKLVSKEPLTKPAKSAGDKILLIGVTGKDGNDSLYRAGLVDEMIPAVALFEEEKAIMEASIKMIETNKIKAMSDLGAAGIGAAVCESARYGGYGAEVDLTNIATNTNDITPEEILICETQGRMVVQVAPGDDLIKVLESIPDGIQAQVIGTITDDDKEVFVFDGKIIATIPNEVL